MDEQFDERMMMNGAPVMDNASVADLKEMILMGTAERWEAFEALERNPAPEAVEVLMELSGSPDHTIRRAAVTSLAQHPGARQHADLLRAHLLDSSPYVVRAACHALAELGIDDAHDSILNLVEAKDPATRETAVRALRNIWRSQDFDAIFRVSTSDASEIVRKEAAWTLRHVCDSGNWKRLFDAWWHDTNPRHRVWACELAASFGDAGHIDELEKLMVDSNAHVRKAAQEAMVNITECQTR